MATVRLNDEEKQLVQREAKDAKTTPNQWIKAAVEEYKKSGGK